MRALKLDKKFLFLLICILSFSPIFFLKIQKIFYNHDSLAEFINYKYIYDHFFTTGEFPVWNPYLSFGITTSLSNLSVTSSEYFSILIGKLCLIKNSLFTFNISIVLNSLLYLCGFALILNHFKLSQKVSFYGYLIAALTLNPLHQIYFDFELITKIPILIYSIIYLSKNFFKNFITFLAFQILFIYTGTIPYFSIIYFYLTIYLIISLIPFNSIKRGFLFLNNKNLLIFIISFFITLVTIINFYDIFKNYQFLVPGRLSNGDNQYNGFLTYGGYTDTSKMINFLGGVPVSQDFNLFLGFIPVLLSFLTITYFKFLDEKLKKLCKVLWGLILLLVIFTHPYSGSIFHEIIYRFPGMNKVRHLAYFLTIAKPLLIILSCIGLNELLRQYEINRKIFLHDHNSRKSFLFLAFLMLLYTFYYKLYFHIFLELIFILFFIIFIENKKTRFSFYIFFIFFSVSDILINKFYEFPNHQYKFNEHNFNLSENYSFPFVSRTDPLQSSKLNIYESSFPNKNFARYANILSYIKEDHCYEIYRQDFLLKNIYQELKNNQINFNPAVKEFSRSKESFNATKFGCNRPKIELINLDSLNNSPNNDINLSSSDYKKFETNNLGDNFYLKKFTANEIDFSITNKSSKDLPLIYYDSFHPYWEGFIDGKKTELYEFNGGFKGLYLASGSHNIIFRIKRIYVYFELIKSITLSLAIFIFLYACVRKINREN